MKIVKYLIAAVLVISITKKVHVIEQQKPIEFTAALTKTDMSKVSGMYDSINKTAFIEFTDVVKRDQELPPQTITKTGAKRVMFGIYPTPNYDANKHGYGGLTKETSLWGVPQTTKPILKNPELTALNLVNEMMPLTSSSNIEVTPEIATIPNLTIPDIKVSGSFVPVKSLTKPYKIIGKYYAKPRRIVVLNNGKTYVGITQHKKTHYTGLGPVWTWMSEKEINDIINDLAMTYGMTITKDNFKVDIKKENFPADIKEIGQIRQNKIEHILYGFLLYKPEIA